MYDFHAQFLHAEIVEKNEQKHVEYIYISQQLLAIFFMKKKIGDFTLSETLFANKVGKKPIRYVIKSKIQSFFPHIYSNHRANSSGTDWLDRRRTQMIKTSPWSHNVYYFFF